MLNKWRTIDSWVHKIRLDSRRGKGTRLNPSREINKGKHRKRKVEKSCVTPAAASTSLTSRINGMTTHAHTHTLGYVVSAKSVVTGHLVQCLDCNLFKKLDAGSIPGGSIPGANFLSEKDDAFAMYDMY